MKQQIRILLRGFLIMTAVLLATACDPDNNGNNDNDGDKKVDDFTTKAGIEAYINAHWQEYGYSAKPTKYIALSIDDGPCPASSYGGTVAMLAALEAAKVKVTFFVIGDNVRKNQDAAQAIFAAGHEIGNHSDGYSGLGGADPDTVTTPSLTKASAAIKAITGKDPVLFRPPNLDNGSNLDNVCGSLGMAVINGTVHGDYPATSATAVKNSVLNHAQTQDGGIIILHDNNTSQGGTMNAMPDIVSGLRAKGFWIMTVSELAIVKEVTLQKGKRYDSIK